MTGEPSPSRPAPGREKNVRGARRACRAGARSPGRGSSRCRSAGARGWRPGPARGAGRRRPRGRPAGRGRRRGGRRGRPGRPPLALGGPDTLPDGALFEAAGARRSRGRRGTLSALTSSATRAGTEKSRRPPRRRSATSQGAGSRSASPAVKRRALSAHRAGTSRPVSSHSRRARVSRAGQGSAFQRRLCSGRSTRAVSRSRSRTARRRATSSRQGDGQPAGSSVTGVVDRGRR